MLIFCFHHDPECAFYILHCCLNVNVWITALNRLVLLKIWGQKAWVLGYVVCTASFWRITKIHTSTAISFFSRKILHDHRVWTNCPSVMPAKVSRLNSITNPPTHRFMNLYQRQLFQWQTGLCRPFQRKPCFVMPSVLHIELAARPNFFEEKLDNSRIKFG